MNYQHDMIEFGDAPGSVICTLNNAEALVGFHKALKLLKDYGGPVVQFKGKLEKKDAFGFMTPEYKRLRRLANAAGYYIQRSNAGNPDCKYELIKE